jgi:hypothetical protein
MLDTTWDQRFGVLRVGEEVLHRGKWLRIDEIHLMDGVVELIVSGGRTMRIDMIVDVRRCNRP